MECDEMTTATYKQLFEEVCPWKTLRIGQEVKGMGGWWGVEVNTNNDRWCLNISENNQLKKKKKMKLTRSGQIEEVSY